jgi:uncharacterized membrane protein
MSTELIFPAMLIAATLLCSLVAGFLFAFAIVVMPGIRNLKDRGFIRAFQVIDGIIQKSQLIFVFVWIGSIIALAISTALGFVQLDRIERVILLFTLLTYLLCVQLPTFTFNVPLNNKLQSLNVDDMDETASKTARLAFEPRWNRWNSVRTTFSCLTSMALTVLLFKL